MASGSFPLRLPSWGWPDIRLNPASVIFSINSFLAAVLALFICFASDLERPYWSVLTVYLTVHPLAGALRSKAVFRVLGTIIGAMAAVILVPNLVNSPAILCIAMAGWIALCVYLSVLDRTPRAYVFTLGGFTTAIVGFAVVDTPLDVFDTAVARVEETSIGILCATFVHSIVWPRDVTGVLNQHIGAYLQHARTWSVAVLRGQHGEREEQQRRSLAADLTDLTILATHLPYDTSNFTPSMSAVRALQDRLAMLLPYIAAVEDRFAKLNEADSFPPWLVRLREEVAAFIERPAFSRAEAGALSARCAAAAPHIDFSKPETIWPSLIAMSAAVRLSILVENCSDSLLLAATVRNPLAPAPDIDPLVRARAERPLHSDPGLAFLSAMALMVSVLSVCAFWIGTAWPSGAFAPTFAAVTASFFAAQDDPAPAIMRFLRGAVISLPFVAFYQFAALPAIDGFPMLVLLLAPFYLTLGYMQADALNNLRVTPILVGFTILLSLQDTYTENFTTFANLAAAFVVGISTSLWTTRIFRSVGSTWSAWRIFRRGWRDLADLASGRSKSDIYDWTSLQLDRLGLITQRIALGERPEQFAGNDALIDLRVGLNLIRLNEVRPARELPEIGRLLDLVADAYERRAAGAKDVFGPRLLEAIDAAIMAIARVPPDERDVFLPMSLAGLRRLLYPDAGFPA